MEDQRPVKLLVWAGASCFFNMKPTRHPGCWGGRGVWKSAQVSPKAQKRSHLGLVGLPPPSPALCQLLAPHYPLLRQARAMSTPRARPVAANRAFASPNNGVLDHSWLSSGNMFFVIEWLKANHLTAKNFIFCFFLFQRQPSTWDGGKGKKRRWGMTNLTFCRHVVAMSQGSHGRLRRFVPIGSSGLR